MTNRKIPFGRYILFFLKIHDQNHVVFWRRPQIRLLHTHPLACNPRRLPHELAGVYSDAIHALGNAKGTLCKGEITTAKSLLSFSLSLSPPPSHTLSLSPSLAEWWKDSIGTGRETMETRSWCTLNGKTLKEKTFIQFSRPVLKAHLYCIILNATSLF